MLNDLEEFAETHEFPEAENLIAKARMALENEYEMFRPIRPKSFLSESDLGCELIAESFCRRQLPF